MRFIVIVLVLLTVLSSCSSPSQQEPHVQNGIIMTPELQALAARLKRELDDIIAERLERREAVLESMGLPADASPCDAQVADLEQGPEASEPGDCDPDLLPNLESHIIDTETGYAYSPDIGLYRPNVYSRDEDGVYRNDAGESLDVYTPTQLREFHELSPEERDELSRQLQPLSNNCGFPQYAPYRHIETTRESWWRLQANVWNGAVSRINDLCNSANNFAGLSASTVTIDAGLYSASWYWDDATRTNTRWGGFINVYDGRNPSKTRYYDFGVRNQERYILTRPNMWATVWVRKTSLGRIDVFWRFNDYREGGNGEQVDISYSLTGLSLAQNEGRFFRSSSIVANRNVKPRSWNNFWGTGFLRQSSTSTSSVDMSTSNAAAKRVQGNEYPNQTCPLAGGKYDVYPVYIDCRDTSSTFRGYVDIEIKP